MRKGFWKRGLSLISVMTVLCTLSLVLGSPSDSVSGGLQASDFAVTVGVGGTVPIRNDAFVDATKGIGLYRQIDVEYEVSERLSFGMTGSKGTYALVNGQDADATAWGGYALAWFDLIPNNHWFIFLKLGGVKSNLDWPEAPASPELLERGSEELPGYAAQVELPDVLADQWQALLGVGVEFYAQGNVRLRLGVDFHDVYENQIGSVYPYVALNFTPFDMKL